MVLRHRTTKVRPILLVLLAFNAAIMMEKRDQVPTIIRNQHIERDKLFDQALADAL